MNINHARRFIPARYPEVSTTLQDPSFPGASRLRGPGSLAKPWWPREGSHSWRALDRMSAFVLLEAPEKNLTPMPKGSFRELQNLFPHRELQSTSSPTHQHFHESSLPINVLCFPPHPAVVLRDHFRGTQGAILGHQTCVCCIQGKCLTLVLSLQPPFKGFVQNIVILNWNVL